jgi:GntR family transcriptional repressor for pyruvate dehydrogenase complex
MNAIKIDSNDAIKQKTAVDQVFEVLHNWITSGHLKAGEILPNQSDLAKQLHVSRNTLREALLRLSTIGFLETRHGMGTLVKTSNPSNYISNLGEHLNLDSHTLIEYIETRIALEKTIVTMVVRRADDRIIEDLYAILSKQTEAWQNSQRHLFLEMDMEFHMQIARACGNSVLEKIYETTKDLFNTFVIGNYPIPGILSETLSHHKNILQALTKRNANRARRAVEGHIIDAAMKSCQYYGYNLDIDDLLSINAATGTELD